MSFDVYLFPRVQGSLPPEDAIEYARTWPSVAQTGTEATYESEVTGVYCYLTVEKVRPDDQEIMWPTELGPPAMSFGLNYGRAGFFARESFEVLARAVADLDLVVYDPQSDVTLIAYDPVALFDSWDEGNRHAVAGMMAQGGSAGGSAFAPRDAADAWWRYVQAKASLEAHYEDEDVFVPKLEWVRRPDSDRAERMMTWTQSIPSVIPQADLFVLGRPGESKRGLLGKMKKGKDVLRLVPAPLVLGALEGFLEAAPRGPEGVQVVLPEKAARFAGRFSELVGVGTKLGPGTLTWLRSDQVIDELAEGPS